ncbi:RNA polymerase sigma-70 factor [uncultured Alistipes sp.]|jgi:RNA polymerase sigma-70 factor|uniref:RNA polymerase sigma-70 factor n=1 Tax=uncultured Alistipes sp. TaxID=538949 RepID=UPI0025FB5467|nr:RNA polymerase sigma-70 factor [uncultured Alistipes sp.]
MNCEEYIVLRKLREGDTEALDVLYLLYAAKVRDFAFRLLCNRAEAEDITHDIFLKVWEERKSVGNVLSFKSYLFRMTRNAIFNAYKHRQVESKYQAHAVAAEKPTAPGADERVTTEDMLEMIALAVENMPEQRRKVFCMSRYENMSYSDIAEALNISPKTVQYHISGALAELRKLLSAISFFI